MLVVHFHNVFSCDEKHYDPLLSVDLTALMSHYAYNDVVDGYLENNRTSKKYHPIRFVSLVAALYIQSLKQ
jgi:hypothetical protein